jgi:cation transport ATPase
MTLKHLRMALTATLLLLFTAQAALAATMAMIVGPAGLNLEWGTMALCFIICTVSGVAALLQRINAELKLNPGPLPRPFLFCAMHMSGSWVAGLLAFIIGQQMKMEVWSELALMIAASYAGARFLEAYVESRMPKPKPGDAP